MDRAFVPVLALAFFAFSFRPAFSAEVLRYGTPLKATPHYDMVVLSAEEKGFWKQNGLEVTWVPFRGATDMYQAVAAGSIEAGQDDTAGMMQAVARGVPALTVAEMGFKQFFSIWVLNASPIKEPRELKGAKVGTSRFGASAYAFGFALVKSIGIEKEVKFVAVGGVADRLAAIKAGAIDAFVQTFAPVANLVVKGELREVATMRGRLPPDWSNQVLYARRDLVDKKPETVKRLVKAVFQSTDFIQDNRAWSVERLKSSMGFVEEAAQLIHEHLRFSRDGKINRKALENVRDFLAEFQLFPRGKTLDLDAFYTTKFVE